MIKVRVASFKDELTCLTSQPARDAFPPPGMVDFNTGFVLLNTDRQGGTHSYHSVRESRMIPLRWCTARSDGSMSPPFIDCKLLLSYQVDSWLGSCVSFQNKLGSSGMLRVWLLRTGLFLSLSLCSCPVSYSLEFCPQALYPPVLLSVS